MGFLHLFSTIFSIVMSVVLTAGFLVVSFVFVTFDELGEFPAELCDKNLVCFYDRSVGYAYIQAVFCLLGLAVGMVAIWTPPDKETRDGYRVAGLFHVLFAVGHFIFFYSRLEGMGWISDWSLVEDKGCADPDITGDPFHRYETYGGKPLNAESDCFFNAFETTMVTHGDTVLDENSTIIKLDWSNPDTFKMSTRSAMIQAANSVGGSYNDLTLPYYYESYYWGCSATCLPDRSEANTFFILLTIGALVTHIVVAVLNFCIAQQQDDDDMPQPRNLEETKPFLDPEPKPDEEEGDVKAPDAEEEDENQTDEGSSNASDSSSPPSNFILPRSAFLF